MHNGEEMAVILIVEDDPYVQRMYKRMFSRKNYELIIAANGESGITLAKEKKPDLVLLDIMLPGINGLEVLEKLKSDSETEKIPVLMLTNLGDEAIIEKSKSLGANFYMVKADFSPDEVMNEVDKYLVHPA
jgi:DNA-binding response OmpR family regulator